MKHILLSILATLPFLTHGQALPIAWQRCYGGYNHDNAERICAPTTGSGYVFAGSTYSEDGDIPGTLRGSADCLVMQVDTMGNVLWTRTIGGPSLERVYSIWPTSYGYIFGGFTNSNAVDVSGNHGGSDAWLVKLDDTGAVIWQKCYGGTGNEHFSSIVPTADGGCLAVGATSSPDGDVVGYSGTSMLHMWVVKINDTGAIEWQKTMGGTYGAVGTSALQASEGGYIVGGYTGSADGDVTGNHGSVDAWLLRLDADGNIVWKRCYGGTGADGANYMSQAIGGGYIFAGQTTSSDGDVGHFYGGDINGGDVWVVRINDVGTILWEQTYGSSGNELANSIHPTMGNNYIIAGRTESCDGDVTSRKDTTDAWVLLINDTGDVVWQKCLGGTNRDMAFDVLQAADTGFVVACVTESANIDVTFNNGLSDCWLVKLGATADTRVHNTGYQHKWQVFPNPSRGHFTLHGQSVSGQIAIQITDITGRVVYNARHTTPMAPCTVPFILNRGTGIYYVHITDGPDSQTLPFVVQQ